MASNLRFRLVCSALALAAMLAVLVSQGMAASGDLHDRLHHHSDGPDHECVVTLMLSGGYGSELTEISPVDVISVQPNILVRVVVARDFTPSHLVGGVLAQAPTRGP